MKNTIPFTANPKNYRKAIKEKKDFYIQFHLYESEVDSVIVKIIHRYLEEYDILYLKNPVLSVIKELINNSIKANLKRLYFKSKDLDITKTDDYRKGMENFKIDVYQNENTSIYEKLYQSQLVIRASFKTSKDHVHISIINNIPILESELKKVNARIEKAYKYNEISDAFDDVIDDSEGAGLGLIMAMMLLKNSGLPAGSFKIYKKDNLTLSTLSIPQKMPGKESSKKITDEILKEIEEIPSFPENIVNIQNLCKDPDSTIKSIAENISFDPGLTTSLLKLANSAGYITSKRVETIEDAVKIIGIKGINTLLIASGVNKIIDTKYKRFETIWNSSYKRAHYAQKLAIQAKQSKLNDYSYLAGLLSDIGKIIIISLDQDLILKLKDISGYKGIDNPDLLEEISLGISHSTLGSMICQKWMFSEPLVNAIEFHHRPYMAPKKYKPLINIVYLAEIFVEIENRKSRFEIVDEDILDYFNLNDKESFEAVHRTLKESYENEKRENS